MKKIIKNANTALNAKPSATEKENLKASRTQARIKKCEIALIKGYKYDKASGEIIGQKGKTIKSKINGYTVISFMDEGCKKYLYATTFIEYILKNENEMISDEEIEFAKTYVKPPPKLQEKRKAERKTKSEVASQETDYGDIPISPILPDDFGINYNELTQKNTKLEYRIDHVQIKHNQI